MVTYLRVAVLSVANSKSHLPIDFELYIPQEWCDDPKRRQEARIPDDLRFQTKPELALQMIGRAIEDGIPRGLVSVDSAYGNTSKFRRALRQLGLDYSVAVRASTKVWPLDRLERRQGKTMTVAEMAQQIVERGGFRRTTWREGSNGKLSARFAMRRVLPIADEGVKRAEREVVWLLMEWEDGEPEPGKYYFVTLPKNTTKKKLVREVKQQWRTERIYEDMKGQLGLDHFEGRRYPGWHHHISVALSCYAFVVAEHSRLFPPSARGPQRNYQDAIAA